MKSRTSLRSCLMIVKKRVGKVESLGVIFDEGLVWNDQFKSLTGKLVAGLSSLKKLKDFLPCPSYMMCIVLSVRVNYAMQMQHGGVYSHLN